jgi:sulfonate transport system substrate-binding protein
MTRFVALVALALIAALGPTRPAGAADKAVLALPAVNMGFAPAYIAADQGFWSKRGLEVKIVEITGIGAMNAVLAKSAEFSVSSGMTIVRANIRGRKVIEIAHMYDGLIEELVISRKQAEAAGVTLASPVEKRAALLKGKKIALGGANTLPHAYLRMFARKGGIDPERDFQIAVMQPDAALAALKGEKIDGFVQTLPQPLQAVQDGSGVLISSGLRGGEGDRGDFPNLVPMALNGIMTRPDLCEEKPTLCTAMVAGIAEGMRYMNDHQAEALAILAKRIRGMDPTVFKEAFDLLVKWMPKTPHMDEQKFARAQEVMLIGKMIKPSEKLTSFTSVYTNKYVP